MANLSRSMIIFISQIVTGMLFRIHDNELERIQALGPLILVMNHVNIFEIPLIYTRLQPRPIVGLVLAERWKNPLLAWILNSCGAIPLERGGTNIESFHKALNELSIGKILIIMPEGTRSGNGKLGKGHPGVVLLAQRSGAPIQPLVTHGGEMYRGNLRRLRRTDFHISVGDPFIVDNIQEKDSRARKLMLDTVMNRIADLLPPSYRGMYPGSATSSSEEKEIIPYDHSRGFFEEGN